MDGLSMNIEKYSIGIGDRFGQEGAAQLRALQRAAEQNVHIVPVWNKSNREHTIIGTEPAATRHEANEAVRTCGWKGSYYVDADHIGRGTVDRFLPHSDFFTIDVADFLGKETDQATVDAFLAAMGRYKGTLKIPGVSAAYTVTDDVLRGVARTYLGAVREAGAVYRYIAERKESFVSEVSVDEAMTPQTPVELFFILAAIAREGIPVQTVAPKFTGSFLKGIDYVGKIDQFAREFEDDLAVLAFAVKEFGLPSNLKLSVHSGSDKFSLYPLMHRAIMKAQAGLHLKTAGTTWLEEVIGLAAAGGEGLAFARELYARAFARFDELSIPYATVISIDRSRLPDPRTVASWSDGEFVAALRHDQTCPAYSIHVRQLLHIAFRIAAEMGQKYRDLLQQHRGIIEENVTANLYDRHILPLFLGTDIRRPAGNSGRQGTPTGTELA
jgi:hypothetical protein